MSSTLKVVPNALSLTTPLTTESLSAATSDSPSTSMTDMPDDILGVVFEMVVFDSDAYPCSNWGVYPPPPPLNQNGHPHAHAYASPLVAALTISHVCQAWRNQIVDTGNIWGRLLDTAHFPKFNNSLWRTVYRRSGGAPIWLRHVDETRTPTSTDPRSDHFALTNWNSIPRREQSFPFNNEFLYVVNNADVRRVRGMELNVWHPNLLRNLPVRTMNRIREVVACHATHLRLGCESYTYTSSARPQDSMPMSRREELVRRHKTKAISSALLHLTFGQPTLNVTAYDTESIRAPSPSASRIRQLCMYGLDINVRQLFDILKTTPYLEELHLGGGSIQDGRLCIIKSLEEPGKGDWERSNDTVELRQLVKLKMQHVMDHTDGKRLRMHRLRFDLNEAVRFDVVGAFKAYTVYGKAEDI